jgi:integrase
MREGELVGLSWDSVNFENGTIYIKQQLQLVSKDNYIETLPKWGKKRMISPAPAIMQLLQEHKAHQEQQAELAGVAWCNKRGYVFTNELGEHCKIPTVYKNFKRIVEKMGLPDIRFHDTRHTYAVTALQAGDDIQAVSENMGHHSVAFTLDTYGHFTPHMREKSANIMDGVFKTATASTL